MVSVFADSPPYNDADDHELMHWVAEGRREALAVLVRRHQAKALALAYRFLGRWDLAEDVCQEAFIRTFRAAADYRPGAAFTTWLYRVVANLCWDQRRRTAREPESLVGEAAGLTDAAPGEGIEVSERRARVREAVARLPDRQRLALILHRYCDLSHRDIAQATGWSLSAVESCLVRAYERLRRELADLRRT